MKSVILFTVVAAFLVGTVFSQSSQQMRFLQNAQRLQERNTLAYEATCTYAAEAQRTAFGVKMLDAMKSGNVNSIYNLNTEMESLLRFGSFCNSLQNLQCQSNGKCGCANADVGYGNFESVRENGACRLRRNSVCMPEEALAQLGPNTPDIRCQTGTSCVYRRDQSGCTLQKILSQVQSSFGGRRPTPAQLMNKLQEELQNGICQCG